MKRRTFIQSTALFGSVLTLPFPTIMRSAPPRPAESARLIEDAVSAAMDEGAEYAEALFITERNRNMQVRKDALHGVYDGEEMGLLLRVRLHGSWGAVSLPWHRLGDVRSAARQACAFARIAVNAGSETPVLEERIRGGGGSWKPEGVTDPFLVKPEEQAAFLLDLTAQALKVTQLPYAVSNLFNRKRVASFFNSLGTRTEQQRNISYVNFAVTAFHQQKRRMDTRSSDREARMTDWNGATRDMQSELETAIQEVLRLQLADPVVADSYDMVIHPTLLWYLLRETLLPHLDIRRILGRDGLAPADRWVSVEDIGTKRIGSDALQLRADATLQGGLATAGWDDSGRIATRRDLISDGVLQCVPVSDEIYGARHATVSPPQGPQAYPFSLAASWNTAPGLAMPNIVMKGGPGRHLNALIGSVDKGLYVKGRGTVVMNAAKTVFRVRPQAAWMIRGGSIAEMVNDVEIETSVEAFWNGLREVGRSEDTFLGGDLFPMSSFPLWNTPFTVATPPAIFAGVPVYRVEDRS